MSRIKISVLSQLINAKVEGNDIEIDGLNLIGKDSTKNSILSYATNKGLLNKLYLQKNIKALIVSPDLADIYIDLFKDRGGAVILSSCPEKDFYVIHEELLKRGDFYSSSIEHSFISDKSNIHDTAIIEKNVIIEDNVRIGAYSIVKAGSVIRHGTIIGDHTIIGAEGFQVLRIDGIPQTIRHVGGVIIENNAYIGDHCTICKSLFDGNTIIGENTAIDNYCQVAHYVNVGKRVIITPGVTIVGGVTIEDDCYIGAGATIMNKATIKKGATVGIGSVVLHNVKEGVTVIGNPAKRLSL